MSIIFEPVQLGPLRLKNRIIRSSLAGRFDNYDGSGTDVRLNWDVRFARGGVAAIISSNAPVHRRGRLVPGFALIDRDDRIPFFRELAKRVHEHDCRYIVQLNHAGRHRGIGDLEFPVGVSSTDRSEPIHGFPCERLSVAGIKELVDAFAQGARRAREAGLDGVEIAGGNGVLVTQFLSSAVNDRKDDYGGSLENRARFPLEIVRAIRAEVGADFYLGFKISIEERMNEVFPWLRRGNTVGESVQVCRWLEQAGVDAIHVTAGAAFPHPRNPPGMMPVRDFMRSYDTMLSSGSRTLRNYVVFRTWPLSRLFQWQWERPTKRLGIEGINLPESRAVKAAVGIPVLCGGGFQTASVIAGVIESGACDAVTIARSLLANPDLPQLFAQGLDRPPKPCTYCNKCLANFLENPLGCYEESRFASRDEMIRQILSVYRGDPLPAETA
ncbi:MAG TPA: NADH:flavin oxidoreductase [Gaiellaceae bacterium]|nr:NADH:flavin oxidoreductase [Gaiellaceae bacterium]